MLSKNSKNLRREQLDRTFALLPGIHHLSQPRRGWIREVREVLGLSAQQIASRIGVSQPTVAKMEQSEMRGSITLASLRKAADVMGCRLTYAFVPYTTFEETVQTRAREVAARLLARVEHTMSLEAQSADTEFRARRIGELADELVRTLSRELWEENATAPQAARFQKTEEGEEQNAEGVS